MTSALRSLARTHVDDLNPIHLVELTRFVADEVRRDGYPSIAYDEQERWHQRIYRDRRVDVWLISWMPAQGTQLHDHGGSAGSFTVVSGELSEAVYVATGPKAGQLRERVHHSGRSVGFNAHYVHDVRNVGAELAISVHAYSAPLESMSYFDVNESGRLERLATVQTEDPEAEFRP